ncbi:MAG: sensor domain-containing diguanylate cyclase [Leptospirales bacterium]|nr:sensor domain-containing diguanylate cyclase [Leptospirales bacterium]
MSSAAGVKEKPAECSAGPGPLLVFFGAWRVDLAVCGYSRPAHWKKCPGINGGQAILRKRLAPTALSVLAMTESSSSCHCAESADLVRYLLENSHDPFVALDAGGRIRQANQVFARICGLAREKLSGLSFYSLIHLEDREAGMERLARPGAEQLETSLEHRVAGLSELEIWISWRFIRRPDSGLWYGVGREISERWRELADFARFEASRQDLARAHLEKTRLLKKMEQQAALLELQSRTDDLTGVYNRRYLNHRMRDEIDRAHRYRRPLALAMCDVDHFKQINDSFSHSVGDRSLARIARILSDCVRSVDCVARYGGEEFAMLFPETDGRGAERIAEKVRAGVQSFDWSQISPELKITVSIGVAELGERRNADELLIAADRNLYSAKDAGRNCVMLVQ